MQYIITAIDPAEGVVRYLTRDGFKLNAMLAIRFRSERAAQKRSEQSVVCRSMQQAGARIEVRRVASAA